MKRVVRFQFHPNGRWATLSGILLGLSFFIQAVNYLLLQDLQSLGIWKLIVMMVLPMVLEAVWCVCLRAMRMDRAEVFGVIGAVFCLALLLQAFFYRSVFLMVLFILLYLLAGAAMVLITWGFIAHRALGALIFLVIVAMRSLLVILPGGAGGLNWTAFLSDVPGVFTLLAMMVFFGNIKIKE